MRSRPTVNAPLTFFSSRLTRVATPPLFSVPSPTGRQGMSIEWQAYPFFFCRCDKLPDVVTLTSPPAGVFGDADPSIIPASEIDSWSLSLARHPRVPMPWSRVHWWRLNHSGRRLIPRKQPMGIPYHDMFVLSVAVQPSIKCICFSNNTPEGGIHKPVGLFRARPSDIKYLLPPQLQHLSRPQQHLSILQAGCFNPLWTDSADHCECMIEIFQSGRVLAGPTTTNACWQL
ncbi:hypothetical protein CEXT_175721 [Caerostris extrusa]|uniref:Uncharacterized protein n=1 Tax=Caerostris extrusa TaxID=172846 RepID=A0AAV4MBB4_CAEEX|nr:hypothetical protein CEXT_175721 [Caerostris extrusa]